MILVAALRGPRWPTCLLVPLCALTIVAIPTFKDVVRAWLNCELFEGNPPPQVWTDGSLKYPFCYERPSSTYCQYQMAMESKSKPEKIERDRRDIGLETLQSAETKPATPENWILWDSSRLEPRFYRVPGTPSSWFRSVLFSTSASRTNGKGRPRLCGHGMSG